ncbi:MAG TPA: hypothetical protein VG962_00690 [Steroidobacteraceae bacterium]|nr:hypothetical protein [Steroidobacteraceae bacterium]
MSPALAITADQNGFDSSLHLPIDQVAVSRLLRESADAMNSRWMTDNIEPDWCVTKKARNAIGNGKRDRDNPVTARLAILLKMHNKVARLHDCHGV